MSYLDLPRLHFSGTFAADPSTQNNDEANYKAATPDPQWNPTGLHLFRVLNCTVKSALDQSGKTHTSPGGDAVVGASVATTDSPSAAKLVDLDPSFQFGSQIWGAGFSVTLATGGGSVTGQMKTAGLRDLYMGRVPGTRFPDNLSGAYQSVLTSVRFAGTGTSAVLRELQAKSPTQLSIKFVVYGYGDKTRVGKLVGTLGPMLSNETEQYLSARRLETNLAGAPSARVAFSGPLGPAPFKIDAGRNKLVIDLGNSMPESTPGGERVDQGKLQALLLTSPKVTVLGDIDFSRAHFEQTAGVEEVSIPASAAKNVFTHRVLLTRSKPSAQQVLSEVKTLVDLEPSVIRLNTGETQQIDLRVLELGFLKTGQKLTFSLQDGTPAAGISFPAEAKTAGGKSSITISAGVTGNPRAPLEGQYYRIGVHLGTASAASLRANIHVRVFDSKPIPTSPSYATDVKPIFDLYAKLYPGMKALVDLTSLSVLRARVVGADPDRAMLMMALPVTDPRFMPVTRDMSKANRDIILKWIKNGMPS